VRPAIVLIAKAPIAGSVKTRIAADVGDEQAARLAAASMLDTMDAVEDWAAPPRRLAFLAGDLSVAAGGDEIHDRLASWQVAPQPDLPFAARLSAAFLVGARLWGERPCVLIGMDSPQVTPDDLDLLLAAVVRRAHGRPAACIGPAEDGGWWGMALSHPSGARAIESVPMSTPQTLGLTVGALRSVGMTVRRGRPLRDMDTLSDARAIAAAASHLRTARELRSDVAEVAR
jgi:glycosyltransferase A (GT-A) superfamily protein (DUF2064 family)